MTSPVETLLALMLDLDRDQERPAGAGAPVDVQFTDPPIPRKEEE